MSKSNKTQQPKAPPGEPVTSHGQVTTSKIAELPNAQVAAVEADHDRQTSDNTQPNQNDKVINSLGVDEVERTLVAAGWRRRDAWFGPGIEASTTSVLSGSPADRKRNQRLREEAEGWRQCTVKAPADQDARTLLVLVGKAIWDPKKREAVRRAITDEPYPEGESPMKVVPLTSFGKSK